jgi:acetyl-CoA synthetase
VLGSVGEPINAEVWQWYSNAVGKENCAVVDTWWQTETGGIMISSQPGLKTKPGSASKPFFGVQAIVVDDEGKLVPANHSGKLLITKPWPGMMQTIHRDDARFIETYLQAFPGYYLTGDNAYIDEDGYFWVIGRNDDVIKVSGHRIGTGEIESAILQHKGVAEAAAVSVAHPIKGNAIYVFVMPIANVSGSQQLQKEVLLIVRQVIGAIATPDYIQWTSALPKTRSGKILGRILRKIANNDISDLGDTSTLADPDVIEALLQNRLII